MEISLIELWHTMGWFARGIVLVLVLMSVSAFATTLRKLAQLRRARSATLRFVPAFTEALQRGDLATAARLADEHAHSHIAAAFRGVLPVHAQPPLAHEEIAALERLIELNGIEQLAAFRRGLGGLATVGATAPFVGLLGTTMGVVHAFTGMAAAGTGGIAAISAGIAEALVVTAFGLLVAIPAVWLYNYFVNRMEYISLEITHAARRHIELLRRPVHARSAGEAGAAALQPLVTPAG
jgi:biopolymer transport protein ExbB